MTSTYDLSSIPERGGNLRLPEPDGDAGRHTSLYEEPSPVTVKSDLDLINEDLQAELDTTIVIPVSTRPGYSIRCTADISGDELDSWRKQAKSKRHSDGINGTKLNQLILANKTTAILRNGDVMVDGYSEELMFRHQEFMALGRCRTAAEAVQWFFGRDAAVDAAVRTLLIETGWGEDVTAEEPDPTAAD